MALAIDQDIIEEVRRFNRKLAWAPRFKIRNRWTPRLGQALLQLSQRFPDRRLARLGIRVENAAAAMDGLRVPLRILRPPGAIRGMVLDIHGGGWVIGNARMNDRLNAALAVVCGVAVVSVDYRLALDAGVQDIMDDCLAAARWLLQGGLAGLEELPVFVVGESAGGHLAAATLLRLKAWPDLLRRVAGAVLYYGVYDLAGTPSVRQAGPETLVLDGPGMTEALRQLTPGMTDAQRRQPPLSPLYGDTDGLPPALMFAGTLDPLRDDTVEMAARWRAGAEVEMHLLPEAPHGLIHFPTRMAQLVTARSHAWIGERLGPYIAVSPPSIASW
jgi:acetyl esterase/lipase